MAKVMCSVACFEWSNGDRAKRQGEFKYTTTLAMLLKLKISIVDVVKEIF